MRYDARESPILQRRDTLGSGILFDALRLRSTRDRGRACWQMRAIRALALVSACFACSSCSTRVAGKQGAALSVYVGEGIMVLEEGGRQRRTIPIESSRLGTGSGFGTRKTPLGEFEIYQKQERHRFAKDGVGVMRMRDPLLAGKTKHEPGRRGVHVHRNLDGKAEGTNGCICPLDDEDMKFVWRTVPVGTRITIRP